jgi:hypothetical protein
VLADIKTMSLSAKLELIFKSLVNLGMNKIEKCVVSFWEMGVPSCGSDFIFGTWVGESLPPGRGTAETFAS